MRAEWYVCKYRDGKFIDKSPHALSRSEADNICSLAKKMNKDYSWRVMHRKDLNNG